MPLMYKEKDKMPLSLKDVLQKAVRLNWYIIAIVIEIKNI